MSDNNKTGYERLKNDGTDPKKKDDSTTQVSTDRTCYMMIVNNIGGTITHVALTHSSGDTNDTINAAFMDNGDTTPPKQISFETGWFADFDYWNISFKKGETYYDTPYNDRCNISYEDAGQTIRCIISTETHFGGDYNLEVKMPKSSSCNFNIDKK